MFFDVAAQHFVVIDARVWAGRWKERWPEAGRKAQVRQIPYVHECSRGLTANAGSSMVAGDGNGGGDVGSYAGYIVQTIVTLLAVCALAFVVLYGARRSRCRSTTRADRASSAFCRSMRGARSTS